LEAAGLRPSILRQLNEALKTPEEGGGAFQLLEYRWPRWSSRGVNFLNRSHPQRKNIWMSKEFSFEIAIGAPGVFKPVVPGALEVRKARKVTFF
jgi:hypothetical protein